MAFPDRPQFVKMEDSRVDVSDEVEVTPEDVRIVIDVTDDDRRKIDISQLLRDNSFVAYDEKDVRSLVLDNETLDKVGDFSHFIYEDELSAFDDLFTFVADNNYQIVTLSRPGYSSVFVIRS